MNEKGFKKQLWVYVLVIVAGFGLIWAKSYGAQAPKPEKVRAARVYAVIPDSPVEIRQPGFNVNKHAAKRARAIAKLRGKGLRVIDSRPSRKQLDINKLRQHRSVGVKIKKAKIRKK